MRMSSLFTLTSRVIAKLIFEDCMREISQPDFASKLSNEVAIFNKIGEVAAKLTKSKMQLTKDGVELVWMAFGPHLAPMFDEIAEVIFPFHYILLRHQGYRDPIASDLFKIKKIINKHVWPDNEPMIYSEEFCQFLVKLSKQRFEVKEKITKILNALSFSSQAITDLNAYFGQHTIAQSVIYLEPLLIKKLESDWKEDSNTNFTLAYCLLFAACELGSKNLLEAVWKKSGKDMQNHLLAYYRGDNNKMLSALTLSARYHHPSCLKSVLKKWKAAFPLPKEQIVPFQYQVCCALKTAALWGTTECLSILLQDCEVLLTLSSKTSAPSKQLSDVKFVLSPHLEKALENSMGFSFSGIRSLLVSGQSVLLLDLLSFIYALSANGIERGKPILNFVKGRSTFSEFKRFRDRALHFASCTHWSERPDFSEKLTNPLNAVLIEYQVRENSLNFEDGSERVAYSAMRFG